MTDAPGLGQPAPRPPLQIVRPSEDEAHAPEIAWADVRLDTTGWYRVTITWDRSGPIRLTMCPIRA